MNLKSPEVSEKFTSNMNSAPSSSSRCVLLAARENGKDYTKQSKIISLKIIRKLREFTDNSRKNFIPKKFNSVYRELSRISNVVRGTDENLTSLGEHRRSRIFTLLIFWSPEVRVTRSLLCEHKRYTMNVFRKQDLRSFEDRGAFKEESDRKKI